jgi:hypothetical protein
MSSTVALNKNAFPTRQHMPANPVQLSPVFLRRSSSANQAFVHFAVTSGAAQTAIALNFDQRFGTFQPAWPSLSRTAFPTRFMPGSCTGVVTGK